MTANIKTKNQKILLSIICVTIFILTPGCQDSPHQKNLTHIDIKQEITRFEQDLFACKNIDDIAKLKESNNRFYTIYVNDIIPANVQGAQSTDSEIMVELYKYITHKDMDSLYSISQQSFENFDSYTDQLQEASKYIVYYFSEDTIQNTTTFISTFQYGSIYNAQDKEFGIGLDMYLGANFEVYGLLNPQNFPIYRVKKFEPYRIVPNCLQAYVDYKVPKHNSNNFIEQAVYEGKKLYLLDLLLPTYEDSLKINYFDKQIEWCQSQEKNMWSYLIETDVLFSSDKNSFRKNYFNDAPFTTPFGNESSPRVGAWLGWQIVRTYMKNNKNITIQDLLQNKDHQQIFNKSGYRP